MGSKFNCLSNLPGDILHLLAFYLDGCQIIKLCRLNKRVNNHLYRNQIFLKELGHQRLTTEDDRLSNKNILKEINNKCLVAASSDGYLILVQYLISKYVDVSYDLLLAHAARSGHLDIVKYLISLGADVSAFLNRAVQLASRANRWEVVKYLISHSADIPISSTTVLGIAIINGHKALVEYLISVGADIQTCNRFVIKYAARNGHTEIIRYLISKDVYIKRVVENALLVAIEDNHLEIVNRLKSIMASYDKIDFISIN